MPGVRSTANVSHVKTQSHLPHSIDVPEPTRTKVDILRFDSPYFVNNMQEISVSQAVKAKSTLVLLIEAPTALQGSEQHTTWLQPCRIALAKILQALSLGLPMKTED